jgi:DNA-binding CsgD family transcriptional regulator
VLTPGQSDLVGRHIECEAIERWLGAVREAQGDCIVIRGEAGIGKSALMSRTIGLAHGFQVIRAVGVEGETELPFAVLHQVCVPVLSHLDDLPGPQRDAIAVAFGLRAGAAPQQFHLSLAVLSLLSAAARKRPLLCVIDDAQWLDIASAQVLAFAARRLPRAPLGVMFSTRDQIDRFSGLPELRLRGLRPADAAELLKSALRTPLDENVFERILAESQGNPLALLELPRTLPPADLAGGFGATALTPVQGKIEDGFRRRAEALPAESRQLLLLAAAEPLGDPVLLWRAASHLGIAPSAVTAAETDGLLTVGGKVMFRHPLVRSAIYRSASGAERKSVHQALATVTDPDTDPDRRAWHRALAVAGPDEAVAQELERFAGRARARGGFAAAAAFLERAALLTLRLDRRSVRALAAASAKYQAGAYDNSLELLAIASMGPLTEPQLAEADLLRGQILFARSHGSDATALLLKAARRFESVDPGRARDTFLHALAAALRAGLLSTACGLREVADAIRTAPPPVTPDRAADQLLDGLALLIRDGHQAAAPILRQALAAFIQEKPSTYDDLRWLWLAGQTAGLIWDDQSWHLLSERLVESARETGALSSLPVALSNRGGSLVLLGEMALARALAAEIEDITSSQDTAIAPYVALACAAYAGDEAETDALTATAIADATRRGEGVALTYVHYVNAVLRNGRGEYSRALIAAQEASRDMHCQRFRNWALPELVEAAVRSGETAIALDALDALCQTTATGTGWAAGVEARCRALTSSGADAGPLYQQAIGHLSGTHARTELARTHLLYGEWLRRGQRRNDAQLHLREAHDLFTDFGMAAFGERARAELEAAGERLPTRVPHALARLTPQERHVCHLAAAGATNAEIASRLSISASTVDYHLRKVFRKLGVRSRTQLARYAPDLAVPADAALGADPAG